MTLGKATSYTHQVHDGKDALAPVIVERNFDRIVEQPSDVGVAARMTRWGAWRNDRVDLASHQQAAQGSARRGLLQSHRLREHQRDLLGPARFFQSAAHPDRIVWHKAVILCQQCTGPNICSELVLGNADFAALKVARRLYAVLANVN